MPGARAPKSSPQKEARALEITKEQAEAAFKHCVEMIKKHDVDSYLTLLAMPNKVQPQIAAIMALNVELATIRDKVTIQGNDTSALYRLQFWRETVQAIYGQEQGKHVPRQPAAIALCAFAPNANPSLLESLISARQGTIGDRPFSNVIELENYGKSTTGALIRLQCEAFKEKSQSADENPVLIEVAEQIGASYAIANLLRSTLPLLTRRVVLLPQDALSHHSVTPDNVYSKKKPDELRKVVKDLCLRSEQLYSEASKLGRKLNRQERLPVASFGARIDYILNTLEKRDYDIYSPYLQRRNPFFIWSLLLRRVSGYI